MTLLQAFNEHLVPGQQGQLVIKFGGDIHLCKILVEDGRAVHISHGRISPEEILGTLASKSIEWVNFIAGYPVRKKLDFPLHENLLSAAGPKPTAGPRTTVPPAEPSAPAPPSAPAEPVVSQAENVSAGLSVEVDKVTAAIEGFIEQVGPLGTILADQAANALNYTLGTPMPQTSYSSFIKALGKEVPDNERAAFIEQFKL